MDTGGDKASVDYSFIAHLRYEENEETRILMKAHACVPRVSLKTLVIA